MIKNKIDFKLINVAIFVFIIYLIYQTSNFWIGFINISLKILLPFFIAFILAYAFYPILKKLVDKKIPKGLAVAIVVGGICAFTVFTITLTAPTITNQMSSLFNGIISFLKEISLDYNIDFKNLQNGLSSSFNSTIAKLGTYISNGAINFIGISLDYLSKTFIIFAAFIYFLTDMDKIRIFIKDYCRSKSKRFYNYVALLDDEMGKYLSGFMKIVIIAFFEYMIAYLIIGHPNAVMLGFLASFGNLVPYFGGIITNIIAAATAFVIGPELFIKTCIVFAICSGLDGYVINPLVYGKSNQVHPLVVIISVFAGGILGGVLGIVISLPVAIILITTFKYFKKDIIRMKAKIK